MRHSAITWAVVPLVLVDAAPLLASTATYEVTFDATWSSETHPGAIPAGAHFSPLVGATHSANVMFWQPAGLATAGIEQMAETGGTTILRGEVQAAINTGEAASVLLGAGTSSPNTIQLTFDIQPEHPLVTLVTMIAPSPDWFLGVHGLELREQGRWLTAIEAVLWPYDAGTDSGTNFTSANQDTNPQEPIGRLDTLNGSVFAGRPALGTYRFQLLDLSTDFDSSGRVGTEDYTIWRNSLGSTLDLRADADGDGAITVEDYRRWRADYGTLIVAHAVSGASLSSPAPEPSGLALLALGLLGCYLAAARTAAGPLGEQAD